MKSFSAARKRIDVSPGESVRILRDLQTHSQAQLSALSGGVDGIDMGPSCYG